MYHSVYEDYKSSLQKLATRRGYFDAEFDLSRLEVLPSSNQAWWRIVFDSKTRYRFGKITLAHSQIREDYLRNIMQIKEGDYYLINDLSKLTNSYNASGWFSSVLLQPTLHEDQKTVDINVITYPRKKMPWMLGLATQQMLAHVSSSAGLSLGLIVEVTVFIPIYTFHHQSKPLKRPTKCRY